MWWDMAIARGEKSVRSVPRSRCSLSWAFSRLSRSSSSLMESSVGLGEGDLPSSAWTCFARHPSRDLGAVV
jgi:hypothetical protein